MAETIKLMNTPRDPAHTQAIVTRMEMAFGMDLSQVRTQGGSGAPAGAQAYVTGSDVFFAPGRYAPGTPAGQQLAAHELAHVVQQDGAPR
jgi:hypothetical protein